VVGDAMGKMTDYTGVEFNEKIDQAIARAGGRLFLATLDRPALERFVREMLMDIERDLIEWRDARDHTLDDKEWWDGYEQGMCDAIVAVRLWAQDVPQ
jgi:hypothetical protein